MIVMTYTDTLTTLCKSQRKWGIYLSATNLEDLMPLGPAESFKALHGAVPWLSEEQLFPLFGGTGLYVLFDTEAEMQIAYESTVGEDGSRLNDYKGPARVFACTCDPEGNLISDNS